MASPDSRECFSGHSGQLTGSRDIKTGELIAFKQKTALSKSNDSAAILPPHKYSLTPEQASQAMVVFFCIECGSFENGIEFFSCLLA
jgi:hypothetical protein